jgi:hypothetical protein
VRFVRKPDVHHTRLECKPWVKPAFCPALASADGGPAVRPIPSSGYKTAQAGGR